jgi:hypothetical protein
MEEAPGRTLICEACGTSFTCYPSGGACWCAGLSLPEGVQEALSKAHADCLCPECLASHARKASLSAHDA